MVRPSVCLALLLAAIPAGPPAHSASMPRPAVDELVDRFYRERQQHLVWFRGGQPTADADDLLELLEGAAAEGLDPANYGVDRLREALQTLPATPRDVEALDRRLTGAFLKLASHLSHGSVDPSGMHGDLGGRRVDVGEVLTQGLARSDVRSFALAAAPRHPEYHTLREALARYRRIAENGGWSPMPEGPTLRPGDRIARALVVALWERLAAEEYAEGSPPRSSRYEESLVRTIEAFQESHGLRVDGKLGPETRRALDVPVRLRIGQIAAAMERWRWLPDDLGPLHVRVNVPAFRLDVVEDGRRASSMAVIVGEPTWQTPIFTTQITKIVLNPAWNVPVSIAEEELRLRVRRDPGFLRSHGFQLVDTRTGRVVPMSGLDWDLVRSGRLRLRQLPSGKNALGRLKFVLDPNPYDVFLHDTPAAAPFRRPFRALSHGCVRVERPLELASRVLGDRSPWSDERIRESIEAGERGAIELDPIPAHLLYFTVELIDGRVHFYPDVYGFDEEILTGRRSQR